MPSVKELLEQILDKLIELFDHNLTIENLVRHIDEIETEEREMDREHWG